MKRVHESVDYIKHRNSKQLYSLTENFREVELNSDDTLLDRIESIHVSAYKTVKDENGAKFTAYIIKVVTGQVSWEVSRRYNDFYKMHEVLLRKNSETSSQETLKLPTIPPKKLFGAFGKDFLDQRRSELEIYLRELISINQCLLIPQVRSFLFKSNIMLNNSHHKGDTLTSVSGDSCCEYLYDDEEDNKAHMEQMGNMLDISNHDLEKGAQALIDDCNESACSELSDEIFDSSDEEENDNKFRQEGIKLTNNNTFSQFPASIGGDNGSGENIHQHMKQQGLGIAEQENGNQNNYCSKSSPSPKNLVPKPRLDDFEMVRVLGKGSFGKVVLCRKRDNGKLYAMKILKKQHVIKRKQVAHTKTERSVLGQVDHPFVVKLHYAFQTQNKLHFVLDFCSGGELFFHLGRAGRFSEHLGRFYAAEIALALGHLHAKGVVYRDLKPENILLDSDGHIKLADFGLSKEGINESVKGTHSFCGTPEYLAPEVLNRTGHGSAVDWWSLGALLYEMLTGLPPWYSQDRQRMFSSIRSSTLRFPEYISAMARFILADFLERDVAKRLGSNGDIDQVKEHPFFAPIEWDRLCKREIPSPFVPRLNSQTDTRNFDSQFTRLPIHSIDQSNSSLSSSMIHNNGLHLSSSINGDNAPLFDGFTYMDQSTLVQQMNKATLNSSNNGKHNSVSASPNLTSSLMFES